MSPFDTAAAARADSVVSAPALAALALGAVALQTGAGGKNAEALHLAQQLRWRDAAQWRAALDLALAAPCAADQPLLRLARQLPLQPVELLAVALAAAVETDALSGRTLAWLQAPVGAARPTLGLLGSTLLPLLGGGDIATLAGGVAVASGLLNLLQESQPLPERALAIPLPLLRALGGGDAVWANAPLDIDGGPGPLLPARVLAQARRHAAALAAAPAAGLLLRSAAPQEARAVARQIAAALDLRAVFIDGVPPPGFEPWLLLRGLLPVFVADPAPGECRRLPALKYYRGPALAICGIDGSVAPPQQAWPEWRLPAPDRAERETLWRQALGDAPCATSLAAQLARDHRHGAGRIEQLARLARQTQQAQGAAQLQRAHLQQAAWTQDTAGLDGLATPLPETVDDAALVVGSALRDELELLLARCRARDGLVDTLGSAAQARYRSGVRALFTGPSGTGKSLAAQWLATRLGMPLYRVDLAAVTSKWIGETEKNLAQLLARAEHADAMLLFDEADALFGKRTEVSDANDRFANAQTNYLLQRIESYDGIIVLTTNSRSRFDSAFTRRLDAIVEFALPDAEARSAIWRAHLGAQAALSPLQLNRLAVLADLPGGHIRNAVLTAAVIARHGARGLGYDELVQGLAIEYRKLGRPLPAELKGEA